MLISAIVPVYNVEDYIDRCINSIVNQTYKNIEIILVDDGSKDSSGIICDNWAKIDSRIVVIHKKNGGLSDARNAGLAISKGFYVSFIDGDDSISANTYEKAISAMLSYDCDISVFGKRKIYKNGKIRITQNQKSIKIYSPDSAINELFTGRYIDESFCDKVFEKSLFEGMFFNVGEINEDLPMIPLIFMKSKQIVHIGENCYNYYQNSNGITRSAYNDNMIVVMQHLNSLYIKYHLKYQIGIDFLLMRYAIAMVFRIGKEIDLYRNDFLWYMNIIKKKYWNYLLSSKILFKDKIKCLMILTGTYRLLL